MRVQDASDILSTVADLSAEDYDRLRLRLWRQFGQQLHRIPDAPTPDDLLHEAIEDLLADRRHCPLARVDLTMCLVNIVRSKVSHLYDKWRQTGITTMSDDMITTVSDDILSNAQDKIPATFQAEGSDDSELREKILRHVSDDPLLSEIVEYRLDHPEARAKEIARAVGLGMQDMYNANRRLKSRLKGVVDNYKE